MMHKTLMIIVTLLLIFFPSKLDADESKSLKDLIEELDILESELKETTNNKELTEEKIKYLENNVIQIGLDVDDIEKSVIKIQEDINHLNTEINIKEKGTKQLINLFQLSNSNELYLEYVFGSLTYTDFIFRYAVVEQLVKYNENLIKEMNNIIIRKKEKDVYLKSEKEKLEKQKEELLIRQLELGERMNFLDEDVRNLEEEIMDARRTIDNYRKLGCRSSDLLEICAQIPFSNTFLRPLNQGHITSSYGLRDNPLTEEKNDYVWHYAIDIGGNAKGTPIYAVSSGRVVLINAVKSEAPPNSSCGGNYLVIQHHINGVYYATRYAHLNQILVTENEIVDNNTIIGLVGGGEGYDRCSTGPHLDFSMAEGIYAKDFFYFREPYTINPTTLINFPSLGVRFYNRYDRH